MSNSVEAGVQEKRAVRLRKAERLQLSMEPHCIDDLVGALHPVRTVMGVVEKLEVSGFCERIRAREGQAGRDATDPRLLVGLWLYGCTRGVGSARELARRCEESAPFRWLCGGVTVNHHLLSDFRIDHADALDDLFTQVIVTLVDKKLVRVSRISQDGVRVRVSAGSSSFRREERLQQLLEQARQQVQELRAERLTDLSGDAALGGAESKDPDGAYLTHAARSFSTTEARSWPTHHGLSLGPRTRTAGILLCPGGSIYLLGSHTGTLYIGVTSNLYLRVMQHKEGQVGRFHCSLRLQAPALL